MPHILDFREPDFEAKLESFLSLKRDAEADVKQVVADIIADVRVRGAQAVIEYTRRFDGLDLTQHTMAVSAEEIDAAIDTVPVEQRSALELAARRIEAFHRRQLPANELWTDETGATLGWRWTPVDVAGIYVPGGLASYPSSVLMNAIAARVAGVRRIIMCAPTPDGETNPLVLLAARQTGVSEIFRVGGTQAIAAMAFGADPIPRVDKVTGPGNVFVAEAKRQVFGQVGIDMIAGPSEVLVIADETANPDWIALDLMAQAEHGADAQAILLTTDPSVADRVDSSVAALLPTLARAEIAGASWRNFGAMIIADNRAQVVDIANRIAPEHLEIQSADGEALAAEVRHAGAIFIGPHTPEAIGDYCGGPNHVLPTGGSARFSSGLSVLDFMKRTTISRLDQSALELIGPAAATLARSEGLEAHELSVSRRLGGNE